MNRDDSEEVSLESQHPHKKAGSVVVTPELGGGTRRTAGHLQSKPSNWEVLVQ